MNVLKNMLVLVIFASVISLAILGGTWATSFAARGTVPRPPAYGRGGRFGGGPFGPGGPFGVIPVTGAGALIPVTGAGCTLTPIEIETLPKGAEPQGEAYTCDGGCQFEITDPALIEAFKKDPNLAIFWYPTPYGKIWVKLTATLVDGKLVATIPGAGFVVFGSLE
ncbi:MAG: hypothetical protein MUO64_13545 [Anaerolineales bacterium]|nr:hypothetical protein [Anaerolineales bacterium]